MAFKKGEPRLPNAGRKKGTPNKSTVLVKSVLAEAFEGIGGVPALIKWAEDNQTEFYKLFVKLLPVQVDANVAGSIAVEHSVSPAVAAMLANLREVAG